MKADKNSTDKSAFVLYSLKLFEKPDTCCRIEEIYGFGYIFLFFRFIRFMTNFVMILHLDNFKRSTICIKAREFICLLVICKNMTADKIVISGSTASALR